MIALLTDPWFEAQFIGNVNQLSGYVRQGERVDGAQGIFLWCPCAYGNDARAHGLIVPFANPRNAAQLPANFGPVARDGHHPRWQMSGTGLYDLTLSPSVAVGAPECWHGFITNGRVL